MIGTVGENYFLGKLPLMESPVFNARESIPEEQVLHVQFVRKFVGREDRLTKTNVIA